MSRECTLDDIVTEFLQSTCRLSQQASEYDLQAALVCSQLVAESLAVADCDELIPLTTGSVAEFYIQPMLQHVGDVDVMFHRSCLLAIPQGYPPPTQLPAEFHSNVKVYEIIDSGIPGYVHLRLKYLLSECSDDGSYNAVDCHNDSLDKEVYLTNFSYNTAVDDVADISGPAKLLTIHHVKVDLVRSERCLSWPLQAADWPTRNRNRGWPDSATLDLVVSNGCDVVGVAHRLCKGNEITMPTIQWRLSFSRAEIVLINSWMPVQQIVYHMLRYFTKTELFGDDDDNAEVCKLSNYHIKSLMLWACEVKPRSWWTDDVSLVRICVQLLRIFSDFLTFGRCKHYFIHNSNLIDNSFKVTKIRDQLDSIDETWLSRWFVDNYIQKCLQSTPSHVSQLFAGISTSTELQNAVSALVAWRPNNSLLDFRSVFHLAYINFAYFMYTLPVTARSCAYLMTEMAKIDSRLSFYFTAMAFLHVAHMSQRHGLNDELMDILATVCGQFTDTQRYPNNSTSASVLSVNKAAKLMKVVANKSLSTMSQIETELSKAYLHRALRCKDSDSDSVYCLANVYLAVLYYTTGQYQTAIDHCTLVTRSQDHSQCSSHVVQGEILPKIDDNVDNILGLAVFYQHLRMAALKQETQPQLVSVFTTELFAGYLHVQHLLSDLRCRQFMQTSSTDDFKRYCTCIGDTQQLFIGDVLLSLSIRGLLKVHATSQHALMNESTQNAPDLVELLQKSAIEHLTTFRQLEAQAFGSVVTTVTTDYEALYAYKRGEFQRCLQLSTQNVHGLLDGDAPINSINDVPVLPMFIQLMDDDIVSLTALMLTVNLECRAEISNVSISQLTLSLYLMTQCQLKLHHPVKSTADTLLCIKDAQGIYEEDATLNHLVLKLIERKAVTYIFSTSVNTQ